MPTSVTFSPKVASDWDPQKALTTTKLNKLFDNTTNLHERLGGDYDPTVKNHNHDGVNSAAISIGANSIRNGSFEDGLNGWVQTVYTGGTIAVNAANHMHGANALAITSTVLVNGGGDVTSTEYDPVTAADLYAIKGNVKASVANVSCKVEVIWYDNTKAQISASTIYSSVNTPTAQVYIDSTVISPANARYKRIKLTGGVPNTGTSIGTIYFDGIIGVNGVTVPTGKFINHSGTTAPPGYLVCPTAQTNISRTAYAALFAAIGTQWGAGDGSTTFGMPWFPADYTDIQANGNVGASSVGVVISHAHQQSYNGNGNGTMTTTPQTLAQYDTPVTAYYNTPTQATGGAANYPAGMRVLKCVKY